MDRIFKPADILVPVKGMDMTRWSVVACDQYTSEPEYWASVDGTVGDAPSTLRITLPEVYLESGDEEKRIADINSAMKEYCEKGIFDTLENSFVYVERKLKNGKIRKGLVGTLDLDAYDYNKGSQSPIRATEGTVLSRIPPRVKIRKDAPLELPHIMVLIDDREKTVIEPLADRVNDGDKVYDFTLMKDSGAIKGWQIKGGSDTAEGILTALDTLGSREVFDKMYGLPDQPVMLYAMGDGNHSLATAKSCYDTAKAEGRANDGLALVEIVNLHDESLEFEPIHRLVFDIDPDDIKKAMEEHFKGSQISVAKGDLPEEGSFFFLTGNGVLNIKIADPTSSLSVGCLQEFLDGYVAKNGGRIDYIHGEDTVKEKLDGSTVGFILPKPEKNLLFKTVILDGALPRKTFSMGHAEDKRFYLEARKI